MLVSLQEAAAHIRVDSDADDAWLTMMIDSVSDAVLSWLKDPWRAYVLEVDSDGQIVLDSDGDPIPTVDSDGNPIVKPRVKAAVLVELAMQYRFREGDGKSVESHWGHGYVLGAGATSLLASTRKSTVA